MSQPADAATIRLRFSSTFEVLDVVQAVALRLGRQLAIEEDGLAWMEVAIRECVINAIKHGNRFDAGKQVSVDFALEPSGVPQRLVIVVRDEGEGFDPDEVQDPLAPENILKASGRGIFFMRSFMDDVRLTRHPEGGMEVRLVKNLPPPAV